MKNKIAMMAALLAASSYSYAEIAITENLSFEGFIDMSYTHVDFEEDGDFGFEDNFSDNSFQVDQVEISWLFDFDKVTGQIDMDAEDSNERSIGLVNEDGDPVGVFAVQGGLEEIEIEQAFATYHLDNGGAITAGRYASMLGFEAFEPTGLYQYSFAYDSFAILPGYNQGVKYTYESDDMFFGISLQDGIYQYGSRLGGSNNGIDNGGWGAEIAAAFYLQDGLTWFVGGAYEEGDGLGISTNADDTQYYTLNTYVTYETGAWIFAAELAYGEWDEDAAGGGDALDVEAINALIMANYAYSDAASVTGRISYVDYQDDADFGIEESYVKFTLAHGYAFTDNLALVTEVSYTDGEFEADDFDSDYEELLGAVELIFSF